MKWRISSNYGTFDMWKIVEASDREAALNECGIVTTLMAAGWHFDEGPDGEEHTAEIIPTFETTPDQKQTLRHVKKIFDNNTSAHGDWDICILEDLAEYLMLRGFEVDQGTEED